MPVTVTTTTTTTTGGQTTVTTSKTVDGVAVEEGVPAVEEGVPAAADPRRHEKTGMYLRWDPNDAATAAAGEAAWTLLLSKFNELPAMDPAGTPSQQQLMVEFDGGENAWEVADNVVPRSGAAMTAAQFTNMLRGNGHIGPDVSIATLEKKELALQGVLSHTFKLVATYSGEPNAGTPTEFIAKFLNPDPAFAFFRLVCGSQGIESFGLEDWAYDTDFMKKAGVRQPTCYFTAYDSQRETFCMILEDMNTADGGYTVGDQLSGGPGEGLPPCLPTFLQTMDTIASYNAKFLNKTTQPWEGYDLTKKAMPMDHAFFAGMWPVLCNNIAAGAPKTFEEGGILKSDDPFWAEINFFLSEYTPYLHSCTSKESGGLYDHTISHGDVRSENIFFPKGGGPPALIDFQLLKVFSPEFDCAYFPVMSTPSAWRRENDLALLNVYYDVLIKESGSDPNEYTWEVFLIQNQISIIFLYAAFIFLEPEVAKANANPEDKRKKDMVAQLCQSVKEAIEDWQCNTKAIKACLARKDGWRANAAQEAAELVPEKYCKGRDPSHYANYLASKK